MRFLPLQYYFILIVLSFCTSEAQTVKVITPSYGKKKIESASFLPIYSLHEPKVALVLSGGGARGLAHIGVIRSLEKHKIPIDLIIGTSMGSIVGGLYASGYSTDELQSIADSVNWTDVLSFSDEARRSDLFLEQRQTEERAFLSIRFKDFQPIIPSALSTGQRLTKFLNGLLLKAIYHPDSSFDDLRIPFKAATTDLISGKQVIISEGDLTEALRASTSIPLLFTPFSMHGTLLLDGGLLSNIPVDIARKSGGDIVIAVNATSGLRGPDEVQKPWEMADQILDIMMQLPNKVQLQQSDVAIIPQLGKRSSSDFSAIDSLIDIGEKATDALIPNIENAINRAQHAGDTNTVDVSRVRLHFGGYLLSHPDIMIMVQQHLFSEPVCENSVQRILNRLYRSGDLHDIRAEWKEYNDSCVIVFSAKDNPSLKGISFFGNTFISNDSLSVLYQPLLGKRINLSESSELFDKIIEMYRRHDYALARIDSIYYDHQSGNASVYINEGIIGARHIEGNEKTKAYVVFREVPLDVGDVFTSSKAIQGLTNLMSTNLFEQILIFVRYENKIPVLVIKVQERSTELLRFGLRADNERNLQVLLDTRDENLLGTGTELGFTFSGGLRNRLIRLEYKSNQIFNTYLSFNLNTYFKFRDIYTYQNEEGLPSGMLDRIQTGEYREIKYGGSFSFGTQLERLGDVIFETRYEFQQIKDKSGTGPEAGYSSDKYRLVVLKFGSTIDTQDKYPFPMNGLLFNLSYEFASQALGSKVPFTKMFFSYEQYRSTWNRLTFHPRVMFGFGDETVPLAEQFSLGGQQSFYGLRDEDSRGRQILLINVETRYLLPVQLFFDTYLSARYDLGSTWSMATDIRFRDLEHGIGGSLALDTPVGPAEFGIGRCFIFHRDLPHNPVAFGPTRFYLSIGFKF